jgi:anti-anti-sigma regulatory factor
VPLDGRVGLDRGRGLRGHVCCLHHHAGEYHHRLAAFFTEGLCEGLRVAYAGSEGAEAARADLADVEDLERLLAEGAVRILSLQDLYGTGAVDPERVVATYAAATEEALADGFRGLRVSADLTELVRLPAQQDAFARSEFLITRYMAAHPLSGLCGFDLDLGSDTVAEFASLHGAELSEQVAFQIFGCADGALGLAGQFDPVGVATLARMLTRLRTEADTGALVVDLAGVEYVDHRLLRALSRHARTNGVALSLRSVPPFAMRLIGLLPASYLRLAEVEAGQ